MNDLKPGFEILMDSRPMSRKGQRMLQAMVNYAPPGSAVSANYRGRHQGLMIYGAGDVLRNHNRLSHLAKGGRVIMWDIGYFDRDQSAMRMSIDSLHVNEQHLYRAPSSGRERQISLREDADPSGPILIIGLGRKSNVHLGLSHLQWELSAFREIVASHPNAKVAWRPKGPLAVPMLALPLRHGNSIEEALAGCSMVWCKHSNVAIDAIIAGVPVHCEDGAAFALINRHPQPTPDQRIDFLNRLGWFNWKPNEARQAWRWIIELLSS